MRVAYAEAGKVTRGDILVTTGFDLYPRRQIVAVGLVTEVSPEFAEGVELFGGTEVRGRVYSQVGFERRPRRMSPPGEQYTLRVGRVATADAGGVSRAWDALADLRDEAGTIALPLKPRLVGAIVSCALQDRQVPRWVAAWDRAATALAGLPSR